MLRALPLIAQCHAADEEQGGEPNWQSDSAGQTLGHPTTLSVSESRLQFKSQHYRLLTASSLGYLYWLNIQG